MHAPSHPADRKEHSKALGGALILLALGALAVLVVSLDELIASRTPTVELRAELPETDGIGPGAELWIAGHVVGEVVSMTLLPPAPDRPSRVLAVARMPRAYLPYVRADSRAAITRPGLVGEKALEFSPGSPGAAPLPAGAIVPAAAEGGRAERMLASARRLISEVDTLGAQLRAVGALYRERRPMIERVAQSTELARAELERMSRAIEASPGLAALRDAELSARFERVRASLALLQEGLGRYMTGPLGERFASLDARADSLRADLATLDSLASSPTGFVGRMRSDSALAVEAARTSAQLDSLVRDVAKNPLMFF